MSIYEPEPIPERWCENCGRGYQIAESDAHSQQDYCSLICEEAFYAVRNSDMEA